MFCTKQFITSSVKRLSFHHHLSSRQVRKISADSNEKKPQETFDIVSELKPPELSEEDIELKRNKSRLPERLYKAFVKKEPVSIDNKYEFEDYRLRQYYGRFGKKSGLNPGILWPTREKILETMKYDEIFEPPLQETLKGLETKRLAEEARKKAVEDDVDQKMAKLDKWVEDYYGRIEKKKKESEELKLKRERLVDDISEYLGYDISPKDPRFQEAVEQREREKKKALKVKKQQESYDKMLSKLRKIAESQ